MTKAVNPFERPLRALFSRLNALSGLLLMLKSGMKRMQAQVEETIETDERFASTLLWASRLAVSDITDWPSDRRRSFPAPDAFTCRGTEHRATIDDMLARCAAWSVSQAYEAFKTFLLDQTASYLHVHPDKADSSVVEKFEKKGRASGSDPANLEYWQRFVRNDRHGTNNDRLFAGLRSWAPEIQQAETKNTRALDLCEWYQVVSEVRHAATHSSFVIRDERLRSWSEDRKRLLRDLFPAKHDDIASGYRLRLDTEHAKDALTCFAEYAFAIFKATSKVEGHDWSLQERPTERAKEP